MAKDLKHKKRKKEDIDDSLDIKDNDNVISSKTSHISDVKLQEIIKKLREKDLYYDDLDEFLNSDSKDGVHCSHDEDACES